jgi:hypothetical protein
MVFNDQLALQKILNAVLVRFGLGCSLIPGARRLKPSAWARDFGAIFIIAP